MKPRTSVLLVLILGAAAVTYPSYSLTTAPQIAQDKESGYDRSFFKHWIDENKNGCAAKMTSCAATFLVKK
jgi:hypothetical protein